MFEIILAIILCVGMSRIADNEGLSKLTWGMITLAVCVGSLIIPLAFIRIVLAGVLVFVLMIVYKVVAKK